MMMKLSELIARYGDDLVQFQNLDQCSLDLNMDQKGTRITFGTEQRIDLKGTEQLGLVVWFDRDAVAKIIADSKTNNGSVTRGEENSTLSPPQPRRGKGTKGRK